MTDHSTGPVAGGQRALSAVDVLYPRKGEVVRARQGLMLAFAVDELGRRIPIATIEPGNVVVGAEPSRGTELLVTGLGGTVVEVGGTSMLTDDDVHEWVRALGRGMADGRWPQRLLDVHRASSMVSPGEHIAATEASSGAWVRLTSGSATWCDERAASVGPLDPPILLVRGTWLTAGLRCRVTAVDAPPSGGDLADSLDLMARLAVAGAIQRREAEDAAAARRLEQRSDASTAATQEAVDLLTSAVGGSGYVPHLADESRAGELGAALVLVRVAGLPVSDQAVAQAVAEIDAGRDPLTAVAAACGARPREVTLHSDWWRREGDPMLVSLNAERGSSQLPATAEWRHGWVVTEGERALTIDAGNCELVGAKAFQLVRVLPTKAVRLRDLMRLAFRGTRTDFVFIIGVTILLAITSFITPFLLGQLASLFTADSPGPAFAALFLGLLFVVLANTAFQAFRSLNLLRARSKGVGVSAAAMWERVMRQKASWHAEQTLGERANQAIAVNNASASMPDETVARLLDVTMVVGSLAAIATTNGTMLVALGLLLLVQLVITYFLLRATARTAKERLDASAAATSRLMELLKAANRLRVAGAESRAFLRWAQVQAPFVRADQSVRRVAMAQGVIIAVWPVLTLVIVVWVTSTTTAGFGDFVTAQTAAAGATTAIAAMTLSANGALVARQSLRQAAPALESVPEGGVDGVPPGLLSGGLEAHDLVFRYAPDLPPALNHVNFSVQPGEHLAIVGTSGCGKTTLMRVLLGLEDPESGVIAVDGRDMASLNRPAVRRQIGSVLQSSTLLPCSIKENVDMGRGLAPEQIWAALEAAAVAEDIRAMAMGIDTPVTDGGGTVSGGQRQRILIARALAGNPRMLVLDEATSALDNLTQAAVVEALEALRITRIVVAHRLSTIRHADRIMVMEQGEVVDEGSYDDLMSRPGTFRDLVVRQSA